MKGSIGMPLDNFPLMALGLPNRNRCWLNQALFETKPKGILFKKLPGFFMFLFPGKSLVLFVNFFPSLSHPADRIKYLFHPIIPPSEYEFRSSGFLLTTSNLTWRRSFVGLLPHLSFIGDVDIPFEKYLPDLIGFYLEMNGEYLPSARFDGYR